MKVFHARGFLAGEAVIGRDYPAQYDGKRLDELILTTAMTTRIEIEHVIHYLEIHKFCFDKPIKTESHESPKGE